MEMTKKMLKQICKDQQMYTTCELNDVLYLHYKGFRKIKDLEEYTGLKVLYLEGNGLTSMLGLENQTMMKSLYLQENSMTKIEGLSQMQDLVNLNLSQNSLETIENLGNLEKLQTLQVPKNRLKTLDSVKGLLECPSLAVVDLQNNELEDERVIDILEQMPNLRVLYLKGNPCIKKVKNYRRTVISRLKNLTYLDDRPVFEEERLQVEAWAVGGKEGEKKERERQKEEKRAKERRNFELFDKMIADAKREHREKKKLEGNVHAADEAEEKESACQTVKPMITPVDRADTLIFDEEKVAGNSKKTLIEVVEDTYDSDFDEEDGPPPLEDIPLKDMEVAKLATSGNMEDIMSKLAVEEKEEKEEKLEEKLFEEKSTVEGLITEIEATDFDELD